MAIEPISQAELDKFGIDTTTGRLYFDGKEVVTRTEFAFSAAAQKLAGYAVTAAGVSALVSVVRLLAIDLKWLKILVWN
jgi:hypothetical protein